MEYGDTLVFMIVPSCNLPSKVIRLIYGVHMLIAWFVKAGSPRMHISRKGRLELA